MSVNADSMMHTMWEIFLSTTGEASLGNKTMQSHLQEARAIRHELTRAEDSGRAARKQATWIGLERYGIF